MTPSKNHLRELLGDSAEYATYCREERNFGAILYHLLLSRDNLQAFLKGINEPVKDLDGVRIYFEYSHLRDLWCAAARSAAAKALPGQKKPAGNETNVLYRRAIISMLGLRDDELPPVQNCKEFNAIFTNQPSAKAIQMPSRWSGSLFRQWVERFKSRDIAERICTIKWAFNAKPDIVLHLDSGRVVCIELKVESNEANYTIKPADSEPFPKSQIDVQRFALTELLGYEARFVLLANFRQQLAIEHPSKKASF